MKRFILLSATMLLSIILSAQTQQGYVKTKGRMVNGKHIPGKGLKGATVSIKGRTTVLVNADDGAFSFPVPETKFRVDSVRKKGYQLVDIDGLNKTYKPSPNPIYLVMETPEQQTQDQLDSERKIRRTLQRQLQQREDELEDLKAAHTITLEEYQEALRKLYSVQENNEKLIADMAKEYAQIDYDQMDELNQQISDAILNGRLIEADSLLRSKGNIKSRVDKIKREQQVEAEREKEIAQEQKNLADAKASTQKKLEDVAVDCYKFFDLYRLELRWDSAAYYIAYRAELDTTNDVWQYHAASFLQDQKRFQEAERLYLRSIEICKRMGLSNSQDIAFLLSNLGFLYREAHRYAESETTCQEALTIYRQLAKDDPQEHERYLATSLYYLALLYLDTHRFEEGEALLLEALEIQKRIGRKQNLEHDKAMTLNALGSLYSHTLRFKESEKMYLESLDIYKQLAKDNPQTIEPFIAVTLGNLARLYANTNNNTKSEEAYLKALEIQHRLVKNNPVAYELNLSHTLMDLANLYTDTQRFDESESLFKEALEIQRRLVENDPQSYEPDVVMTLNNLARLYSLNQRFTESEKLLLEVLEIQRRLVKNDPQTYEPDLARTYNSFAFIYQNTQRIIESETSILKALEIYRRLIIVFPQTYKPNLASTLLNYGLLLIQKQQYSDAILSLEESLNYYRELASINPEEKGGYHSSLYLLSYLYPMTTDYVKQFQFNEEWIPILKESYINDPAAMQENYINTLGSQSFLCIIESQLEKAEKYAREALLIDPSQHWINTNLAASLLLQGKYAEAEQLYRQYKDELKNGFLQDLDKFETAGIIPKKRKADVERIKKILNE